MSWAEDVYFERISSLSDIINNGTYIIVINDGTSSYAIQQNTENYVSISLESDGRIKNPADVILWTAGRTKSNVFTFVNNGKYIYNNGNNTTLSATGTNPTNWLISSTAPGFYKMNVIDSNGRYIGWSGSKFAAYANSNYNAGNAIGTALAQYHGALYIYKKAVLSVPHIVTFYVGSNGTCATSSLTEVSAGAGVTVPTVTPNSGYRFKGWSTTETTYTAVSLNDGVFKPSTNCTLYAFYDREYAAKFYVNGAQSGETQNLIEGENVTFPNDPADINGRKFLGWTKTQNYSNSTTAPSDMTKSATMGDADVNYFAVFANIKRSDEWIEITSAPVAGTYAICSESYFMKASISNNRFENGNSSPVIVNGKLMVAPAADCIWEISKPDSYYRIQYGTNYAAGTNSKNQGAFNATVSDPLVKWTITYVTDHFEIVNIGRSQSSDSNNKYLRNNTTYGWATYASDTGSAPRLFKLNAATYSDYCTTVPSTATITIASACTDGETCYSTYSNASAFVVPEGLTISTVGVDSEGKLVVNSCEEGDIVAANTGVMISGAAGDHVVTLTDATATAVPGVNNLHPSSEAMTGDYLFYRLTMHNGTQIGFWWGAEDGAAFSLAANKAYLAVPKGAAVKGMNLWLGNEELTTGIKNVVPNSEASRYDLTGRRIKCSAKGIQFVNGRKVIR